MGPMMRDCGGSVLKDCALQSHGPGFVVAHEPCRALRVHSIRFAELSAPQPDAR